MMEDNRIDVTEPASIQATQPAKSETAPADGATIEVGDPTTFEEMGLHPDVMSALLAMGFAQPMEVQRSTFRKVMAGKDILVQSRTGSGKTAAFGIPFAQGLVDPTRLHVQALALCPTRELALQVATECARIGQNRSLQVVPVYGGAPMGKQVEGLKSGAQIVAGTPGRVLDHLRRGTLKLDQLKVLVLDEADEMLSMGFYEEISEILKRCPTDRQTMLFSATIPDEIERISQRHMRSPEKIALSRDYVSVNEITHAYYMVSGMGRARDLVRILSVEKPDSAVIFCNTREETSSVAEHLRRSGLDAEAISSDLTQKDRERVMGRMKAGNLHYLVATDIAARGIDISDLSHVFNYTFPESAEVYVHRTGRTGRAGKSGVAISLISPRELGNFYYLKLTYKIRPEERELPTEEQVATRRDGERLERLQQLLGDEHGKVPVPGEEWMALARRLWAGGSGEGTVARLLERFIGESVAPGREPRPVPARSISSPTPPVIPTPVAPLPVAPIAAASTTSTPVTSESPKQAPAPAPRKSERNDEDRPRRHERDRERRGGRERGRGDQRRGQERRPVAAPPPPQTTPARRPLPGSPTIELTDGREFWETWVDDRTSGSPPASPSESAGPATPAESPRPPRAERPRREREELQEGTSRLYFSLGRRDDATQEEVDRLIAEKGLSVQRAELYNSHTYLVVADENAEAVINALHGGEIRGRQITCERARR